MICGKRETGESINHLHVNLSHMDLHAHRRQIAAAIVAVGIVLTIIIIMIFVFNQPEKDIQCKNLVCVFNYFRKRQHITINFRARDLISNETNAISTNYTGRFKSS